MLQLISYFLVEKSINVGVFTLNIFKVNTLGSMFKGYRVRDMLII